MTPLESTAAALDAVFCVLETRRECTCPLCVSGRREREKEDDR